MLFGIARLIGLALMAWIVFRSPLRRSTQAISRGGRAVSDRQLVVMCLIMAATLALGVVFKRLH